MQVGVVFPHTELSGDPGAVRDFTVAAESLGYRHVLAFDHVLGAHPSTPGYEGRYTSRTPFTDPFVLFAFMAAATTRLSFASCVVILSQRQTALVAKQAADLSLLSGGRFRLGVGTGWNALEYEALGVPFSARGARQEAQVGLLRRLWNEETVKLDDRWHRLSGVGITPRPRAIVPIWFGGNADAVIDRVARLGDGWFPLARPGFDLEPLLERLDAALLRSGRDRTAVGVEGFASYEPAEPGRWVRQVEAWAASGASHLALRTGPTVLPEPRPGVGPTQHIDAMRRFAEETGLRAGGS